MYPYFTFICCFFLLFSNPCAGTNKAIIGMSWYKEVTLPEESDTLFFEDEIARHPFLTDTISVAAIQILFGDQYQISKQPVPNRFVQNQIDTLITIKKGQSYIRLYVVSKADKCFFEAAEITDNLPVFRQSVRIGQSKTEVKRLFPIIADVERIPDFIAIMTSEGADFLFLTFKAGKLHKVTFHPYLD